MITDLIKLRSEIVKDTLTTFIHFAHMRGSYTRTVNYCFHLSPYFFTYATFFSVMSGR